MLVKGASYPVPTGVATTPEGAVTVQHTRPGWDSGLSPLGRRKEGLLQRSASTQLHNERL